MAGQAEVQAGAQALQAAFPTLGAAVAHFERTDVTDAFFEKMAGIVLDAAEVPADFTSQIGAMSPERYARAAKRAAQLAVELAGALAGAQQVSSKVRWLAEASLEEIEQRRRAARPSEGSRRA